VPGYPIRTSSDPCSVDSSPRHIAASHVLHRLSMPRHPPCALTHLQTQKPTIKKIKIAQNKHTTPTGQRNLLRCSQPLSNYQTPHPTTKTGRQHQPTTGPNPNGPGCCLRTQQCAGDNAALTKEGDCCCAPNPRPLQTTGSSRLTPHEGAGCFSWCSLERR
jgi:hypothetical protein